MGAGICFCLPALGVERKHSGGDQAMRGFILFAVLVAWPSSAEAQFLRRIFGGRQQVQTVSCYQQPTYYHPSYQQQYYQPNYVAVAAIPLATVPVAVDLQAYQYSVNAQAFQSFRDYQASKVAQVAEPVQGATVAAAPVSGEGSVGLTGAVVLKQRCASCHTSGKNPRFFDAKGDLLAGAPMAEMLERITTDDPAQRMPPKGQLPTREAMAVMNHFISGIVPSGEKLATSEPTKPVNPFE